MLVAPIEGVKARLQVQYNAGTAAYKGPVDCFKKVCRPRVIANRSPDSRVCH